MHPRSRRLQCRWSSSLLFLFISAIWGAWSYHFVAVCQDAAGEIPPLQEPWRIVCFGAASGLPSAHVHDFIETADGTRWAATESGLAWYDGYRWRTVRMEGKAMRSPVPRMQGVLGDQVVFRTGDRVGIADTADARLLPLPAVSSGKVLRNDTLLDAGDRSLSPFGISMNGDGAGILLLRAPSDLRGVWEWEAGGRIRRVRINTTRQVTYSAVAMNGDAIVTFEDGLYTMRRAGKWSSLDPLPDELAGAIIRFTVPPPIILRWYIFAPLLMLLLSLAAVGMLYLRRRREYIRDLYESRERLKSLAEELVRTEERERRRMATYLHDVIGQGVSLAFLKLHRWQKREAPASAEIDDVRWILDHVIQDAHTLTFELCPPIIHDLDLAEAITWQVRQLQRQHDLRLYTAFNGYSVRVSPELHVLVFRAVRELIVNAMKHAQATSVGVEMSCTAEQFCICVVDDGVGFPKHLLGSQNAVQETGAHGGFGIQSMRRRLADFSTDLEIRNRNGNGALVCLRIPREEIIELQNHSLSDEKCEVKPLDADQRPLPVTVDENNESTGRFVHPQQEFQ